MQCSLFHAYRSLLVYLSIHVFHVSPSFQIILCLLTALLSARQSDLNRNVKPPNSIMVQPHDSSDAHQNNELVNERIGCQLKLKCIQRFEQETLVNAFSWLLSTVSSSFRRSYFRSVSHQELLEIVTQDVEKNGVYNFNINSEMRRQKSSFLPFLPPLASILLNYPYLSSSILLSLSEERISESKSENLMLNNSIGDANLKRNKGMRTLLASDRILTENKMSGCVGKDKHADLLSSVCADIQSLIFASAQIIDYRNNGNYDYDNSKISVNIFDTHWLEYHLHVIQKNSFNLTFGRIELHTRLVRALGWGLMSCFCFENEKSGSKNENKNENENENENKNEHENLTARHNISWSRKKTVGEDAVTLQDIVDLFLQLLAQFQTSSPFLTTENPLEKVANVAVNDHHVAGKRETLETINEKEKTVSDVTSRTIQPYVTTEITFCVSVLASCLTTMSNITIKDTKPSSSSSSSSSSTKRIKNLSAAVGPMMVPILMRLLGPHITSQHTRESVARIHEREEPYNVSEEKVGVPSGEDPPALEMRLTLLQGIFPTM